MVMVYPLMMFAKSPLMTFAKSVGFCAPPPYQSALICNIQSDQPSLIYLTLGSLLHADVIYDVSPMWLIVLDLIFIKNVDGRGSYSTWEPIAPIK